MFFRDQARALIRSGAHAGVAFVERKSFSTFSPAAAMRQRFQIESQSEDGIPTVRMKAWGVFPQTMRGAMAWCWLTRRLVREYVAIHGMPDVIHGHGALWGGYAAMLSARDLGLPYVITEHASAVMTGEISAMKRAIVEDVYRNAAAVVAVSRALQRAIGDAEVIPNCVDEEFFRPVARRSRSPFTFLFAGDLVRSKRVDLLLRAFARGRAGARLVIVGTGRQAYPHHDGVRFTGALDRAGVREEMWRANALVLPSDYETFGVVLIEALATGLPVIATRCGGPQEIVTRDDGILVDCGDEAALAGAMASIRRRTFSADRLAASAAARFGYKAIAPRLWDVYQSVVRRPPQRAAAARA